MNSGSKINITDYESALEYVHSKLIFGSILGLERIGYLLNKLSDPQNSLKFIHVAGTNGKGSSVAMTASILKSAGYKVGMYISPYVLDFRERISINGEFIKKEEFAQITCRVAQICEQMNPSPTEFEVITAIALVYFKEQNCDFVVFETGLGGRYDATNVISTTLVSLICKIAFDHMQYLGDTLEKIAYEKAGIIKQNSATVCYCEQDEEAYNVIKKVAYEKNNEFFLASTEEIKLIDSNIFGSDLEYRNMKLHLPLAGRHQIKNLAGVLSVVDVLKNKYNIQIKDEHIINGISDVSFPARAQIINKTPLTILDAAHNPDGASALVKLIDEYLKGKKIYTVMGMLADKEYEYCISEIAKRSCEFFAVSPVNPRKLEATDCALVAEKLCNNVTACESISNACNMACNRAGKDDVILYCGSLYVAGEVAQIYGLSK